MLGCSTQSWTEAEAVTDANADAQADAARLKPAFRIQFEAFRWAVAGAFEACISFTTCRGINHSAHLQFQSPCHQADPDSDPDQILKLLRVEYL